jgi:VanZ family protein
MSVLVRYWLPVLLYVSLIFGLSSFPGLQAPVDLGISDKLVHATEYGLLGFLLVRALRGSNAISASAPAAAASVLIGLVVALADELYQSLVPGRSSDPLDYAADASGLVLAATLFLILRTGPSRRGRATRR